MVDWAYWLKQPTESDQVQDVFAGAICALSIVTLITLAVWTWRKRKNRLLSVTAWFSIVHLIGVLLVNKHYSILTNTIVEQTSCFFWSYVIQYALGLGPFITLIFLRLCLMIGAIQPRLLDLWVWHKRLKPIAPTPLYALSVMLSEGTLMLVCLIIGSAQWSHYDSMIGCISDSAAPGLIAGWSLSMCFTLLACLWYIRERHDQHYQAEQYEALRNVVLVAIPIVFICFCLALFGLINESYGKLVFMFLICSVHVFVVAYLSEKQPLSSMIKTYVELQEDVVDVKNINLLQIPYVRTQFLSWCRGQENCGAIEPSVVVNFIVFLQSLSDRWEQLSSTEIQFQQKTLEQFLAINEEDRRTHMVPLPIELARKLLVEHCDKLQLIDVNTTIEYLIGMLVQLFDEQFRNHLHSTRSFENLAFQQAVASFPRKTVNL